MNIYAPVVKHCGVINENVPCLVTVIEGWLAGEIVADFYGLGTAATKVINLSGDALVLGF